MNIYARALAALVLCMALAATPATESSQQPSVALPAELAQVLRDYERAWSQKDAPALAELFVDDGFVLSPGNPMVRGKAAIQAFYRGSGGPLALRAVAFARKGNVGYIIGAYAVHAGEPDRGKFTLTLHRDASGRWMIVSDMDSGNEQKH